jgi:hypothetical protein
LFVRAQSTSPTSFSNAMKRSELPVGREIGRAHRPRDTHFFTRASLTFLTPALRNAQLAESAGKAQLVESGPRTPPLVPEGATRDLFGGETRRAASETTLPPLAALSPKAPAAGRSVVDTRRSDGSSARSSASTVCGSPEDPPPPRATSSSTPTCIHVPNTASWPSSRGWPLGSPKEPPAAANAASFLPSLTPWAAATSASAGGLQYESVSPQPSKLRFSRPPQECR